MRIRNLRKAYDGHIVLEDVNLELPEGGIYALTGPSGSGKTTLLHILLGLVRPDGGTVEGLEGRRFSAVFQENRLFEFLTAAENIEAVCDLPNLHAVLAEILPEESLTQTVGAYSGGMKRRVAIARAVLAPSDILIMDEPLTGLDPDTKEQVISFILKYRNGRTLLFSTHVEQEVPLFHARQIRIAENGQPTPPPR